MRALLIATPLLILAGCSDGGSPVPTPTPEPTEAAGPPSQLSPAPVGEWGRYRNLRFDFVADVPPGFTADAPPARDDGRVFRQGDAVFRIAAAHNALNIGFDDQIASMRKALDGVAGDRTGPATWQAVARQANREIHLVLIRPAGDRLITARFDYPAAQSGRYAALARQALDRIRVTGHAGAARYDYDPRALAPSFVDLALPPRYERTVPGQKLIPVDRLGLLGAVACHYGQSGEMQRCTANREPGLSIAISDLSPPPLRAAFPASAVVDEKIGGQPAFRVVQQAEGEGATYHFVGVPDGTLVLAEMRRGGPPADVRRVIESIHIDPAARDTDD